MLKKLFASRWNKQKFRCYEAKIEESEKGRQPPGIEPRTSGLCSQCSATELRQPDNHQPPQSSICTAQVGLKCLSCNTWQPLSMCRQNSVRGRPENSLHQERTHAEWFSRSKCLELFASRWNKQKFRCYEAKIEESEKGRQPPGIEPRTSGLCSQCSATELRQPDNHQPPQSSICTAQVGLKCLSCNTWQPFSMCRQNSVRGRPENSLHQERTHAEWFSRSKCLELFASRWNKQKFRCYEAKIEESEKGRQPPGIEPRTSGLCSQCSATELRQPDNHQPPQSSICTAQVGLKCLSCNTW